MKKIFISLCVLILGLAACQENEMDSGAEMVTVVNDLPEEDHLIHLTKVQFEASEMELGNISKMAFPQTILTNGYIDVPPKSRAAISVYYGGYVKDLDLLVGQWVKKGEVLFGLENPDFVQMEQDYVEAKASLAFLKSDYERQKTLAAEQIASQKNYLKAETDYQVQLARIEGLRKKLELLGLDLEKIEAHDFTSKINIYSPISGYVTAVKTTTGSNLSTSDVAVEIINTNHLHLELDVFEKHVQALRKGQKISFRVPGKINKTYPATVHLIGTMVEGENRVVRVHGHMEEERSVARQLIPGMFVEAEIIVESDTALALPEEAVVNIEDEYFVLMKESSSPDDYTFEKYPVQPGRTTGGWVEIVSAKPLTGPILTKGAFNLIME